MNQPDPRDLAYLEKGKQSISKQKMLREKIAKEARISRKVREAGRQTLTNDSSREKSPVSVYDIQKVHERLFKQA